MLQQKVKRLSEELNCQRQNAESARQSLEQKIKAKEKEYQQVRQAELFNFNFLRRCNHLAYVIYLIFC